MNSEILIKFSDSLSMMLFIQSLSIYIIGLNTNSDSFNNNGHKSNFINYSFDHDPISKNINSSGNNDDYKVSKKVFADEIKMMYEFIEFKYFKKVMKQNNNIFNSQCHTYFNQIRNIANVSNFQKLVEIFIARSLGNTILNQV